MDLNTDAWSGDGDFTRTVIDGLSTIPGVVMLRVEDAPASRAEAGYAFLSNEIYVGFATTERIERSTVLGVIPWRRKVVEPALDIEGVGAILSAREDVGPADYADEGMLQYLRSQRIVPPYQTRGYKLVEMVRIYALGAAPRR